MELPETDIDELAKVLSNSVQVNPDDLLSVLGILDNRTKNLESDIVVKQRHRFELLEEKVKTLLEERSLSGGSNQITSKQLQKLMHDTESGMKGKGGGDS